MSFNTSEAEVGKSAMLESRILYPKRNQQCLQFFYKMTGTTADDLVIWMKTDDGTGNVRKMKKVYTIQGVSNFFYLLLYFCAYSLIHIIFPIEIIKNSASCVVFMLCIFTFTFFLLFFH